MSAALIARLKKQRELKVTIEPHTFICRRPTDVEMIEIGRAGADWSELAARFVVEWEKVTENDVVGGGGSDAVPFSSALWRDWSADRPDFWEPIATALLAAYSEHRKSIEATRKK